MSKFGMGVLSTIVVIFIAGAAYVIGARSGSSGTSGAEIKEPAHRALVRSQMIDPASAIFESDTKSQRDPNVWCGLVNGRNRMGGMTGKKRYIAFLKDREVNIDGETAKVPLTGSGAEVFAGRWRVFCE